LLGCGLLGRGIAHDKAEDEIYEEQGALDCSLHLFNPYGWQL
jgi:hypothetical protein